MKEKGDIQKILEGRCRGYGSSYVGFKKANESHSTGTATQICDPIADRIVDTLSTGETAFFWLTRFEDDVEEIREQMYLIPDIVAQIAQRNGFRIPNHILTTDFLVRYKDGTLRAFSIKASKKVLMKESYKKRSKWEALVRRQTIEKQYWESLGIQWKLVFSDELNHRKANNIASVMKCYDKKVVTTPDHMYRYLIAHKHIVVDMDDYIPFSEIARKNKDQILEIYERVTKDEAE